MNNIMKINGHAAIINFDPEIEMFRGDFVGLNGGVTKPLLIITRAKAGEEYAN